MTHQDVVPDDPNDLEALSILVNYREWIVSYFAPFLAGQAVEYGAGTSNMSEVLIPHVDHLDLVEPHPHSVEKLRSRYAGRTEVRIVQSTIEANVTATADESYDTAVMVNVLEHVADDRGALRQLWRVLRGDGALCLFVPAHAMLFSAYDRLVGHYRRYELDRLTKIVSDAGFTVIERRYFDALGVLPWLLTMKLLGNTRISPGLAGLYDRVAVPVGRRIEALAPPFFGKNIVMVARKSVSH